MKAIHDLLLQSLRWGICRPNGIVNTVDYMYLDNPTLKAFRDDHYNAVINFVNGGDVSYLTISLELCGEVLMVKIEKNHRYRLTIAFQYEQGELTMVPTHLREPKIVNGNRETMISVAIALTSPGLISTVKLTELGVKHVI